MTTTSTSETPWEPPLSGTETEHVLGALDRLRWTFRWKADGLTAEGLSARVGRSTLTLGGLLKHLAVQEDYATTHKLTGAPMPPVWKDNGWDGDDDWEFSSAASSARGPGTSVGAVMVATLRGIPDVLLPGIPATTTPGVAPGGERGAHVR